MPPRFPKGILGVRKDPRNQILFSFNVRDGEEWPSDDEDDSDYDPRKSDSEEDGPSSAKGSCKRKQKTKKKDLPNKKKRRSDKRKASSVVNGKEEPTSEKPFTGEVPPLPNEILEKIFLMIVTKEGALPFLSRAAKVCRQWKDVCARPNLWVKVDLSYGWVKAKEAALTSFCQRQLGLCRELNVSGCKFVEHNWGVNAICNHCPNLRAINLSNIPKLVAGAVEKICTSCKHLEDIDLTAISNAASSQQTLTFVVETCGANLKRLVISNNYTKSLNVLFNKLAEHCPNLEHLDASNMKMHSCYTFDVELFQEKCPKLRSLYLANNAVRTSTVTAQQVVESKGFPELRELSLASLDSNRVTTATCLTRFLKRAEKLRLLDLRGCMSDGVITVLDSIDSLNLEQLYLARSQAATCSNLKEILSKWKHSLTHLDLSWNNFSQGTLDSALRELCNIQGTSNIVNLNLSGTSLKMDALRILLKKLAKLESLDLSSCRDLDRGCKREYKTAKEINELRKSLRL